MKLKFVFNPFTGTFDQVAVPLTKKDIINGILLEKYDSEPIPTILFDEDSILYEDDGYIE